VHVKRDEDGRIVGAGEDPEQDDTQTAVESALLHFSSTARHHNLVGTARAPSATSASSA
jgi:hypothetical protein